MLDLKRSVSRSTIELWKRVIIRTWRIICTPNLEVGRGVRKEARRTRFCLRLNAWKWNGWYCCDDDDDDDDDDGDDDNDEVAIITKLKTNNYNDKTE